MLLIYAKGAVSGIYALCIDGRVVYVGKSRDQSRKEHQTHILHRSWYLASSMNGHVFTIKSCHTSKDLGTEMNSQSPSIKGLGKAGYKPME